MRTGASVIQRSAAKEMIASQTAMTTPLQLATFPRYNVLNAIRVEVGRMDPATLKDLESTRALLVLAGATAESDFTRSPVDEIETRVMVEEREVFIGFIGGLTLSDLTEVEKLPYRRVLSAVESQSIWSRLRDRWRILEGYWYPLAECEISDVAAFNKGAFDEAVTPERLRSLLYAQPTWRIWELREYGPEYEEDPALFEYDVGAEGYWSSGDLDWIIYASHESSVTIGGWLLQDVKAMWPEWQAHVWTCAFD